MITQAEVIRSYGAPLTSDYPKYTAGVAMLETADRFTPEEKEPTLRQFLLLIGGLRALGEGDHEARLVLDAYLLRSLAVAGYAPVLDECARCARKDRLAAFAIARRGHGVLQLPAARVGLARLGHGPADGGPARGRMGRSGPK